MRAPRSAFRHELITNGTLQRAVVALLGATALVFAASCSLSEDSVAGADAAPTFTKVSQEDFLYPEPVAAVADLVAGDDEGTPWHVVGSILEPSTGRTQAAVWTAADGRAWDRVDVEPAGRDASEQMQAATRVDDGLLAVGSSGQGEDADAVVWLRGSDEWMQLAPSAMGGKHEQWAFDVAVGESGIVVIGGERVWGEARPRVWFSTDGREWESVDGGWEGPFVTPGKESITSVTAAGSGFVAVGWHKLDGQQDGLVWYSPDGVTWERVEVPAMSGDRRQAVLSVAAAGDTLVAGGYQADDSGQGQPVAWRSSDGQSWGDAPISLALHDDRLTTANDLVVRSLSIHGDALLAAGGARARPHMWRSSDAGASWTLLPNPTYAGQFRDGVDLLAAADNGSVTLALGAEPTLLELSGVRWVEALDDTFPDGGSKPVATSVSIAGHTTIIGGYRLDSQREGEPQRYRAHVWRRDGEGRFGVIEPEELPQDFGSGSIDAVSAYEDGYVAVGIEDFAVARERLIGGDSSPNGMVWTSEDGENWARQAAVPPGVDIEEAAEILALLESGDPEALAESAISLAAEEPWVTHPPAGGQGTRSLRAVAPLGDGFIAVGSAFRDNDIDPIVVVTNDEETVIEGEDAGLGGSGTQRFHDVCVADGQALAVGVSSSDQHDGVAVRLRDADGEWHEGAATDDSFIGRGNRQALACAASDDGFIVVGTDDGGGDPDAKIWHSEDGAEWQELPAGILGGSGDQQATAVAAVPGGGWLIAGTDTGSSDGGVALWRLRPNGELLRRDDGEPALQGPGPKTVADLSVTPDRTVIVGADIDGIGIWESPTDALDRQ